MDEQIEQALENLVGENGALQQEVATLRQHLHQQRQQFLQEKYWRIQLNMTVLHHEAGEVQQELAAFANQKTAAGT